jgi:hypothetical protein
LILDTLLTPTSNPAPALMDVLFRNAGFSLERVTQTAGRAILESRPV